MNIEAAKIEVIRAITEIKSEAIIKQFQILLRQFKDFSIQEDKLAIGRLPTPSIIDLKQLKKEQNYSIGKLNKYYASLDRTIWESENLKELLQSI